MKTIISNATRNFAILAMVAGVLVTLRPGFWFEDGRLTDTSCYLLLALLFYGTVKLAVFDHRASRGKVDTSRLPWWLQDENDAK